MPWNPEAEGHRELPQDTAHDGSTTRVVALWNLPRSGTRRVLSLTTGQRRTLADLGGGAGGVEAPGLGKGWQEGWATRERWKCR